MTVRTDEGLAYIARVNRKAEAILGRFGKECTIAFLLGAAMSFPEGEAPATWVLPAKIMGLA